MVICSTRAHVCRKGNILTVNQSNNDTFFGMCFLLPFFICHSGERKGGFKL